MNPYPINWQTKDGIDIYAHDWYVENPSAVICLVHGFGEHCRRYDHLAEWFVSRGVAVIGFDMRGHGQSTGKRGDTPSYDVLLDDINGLLGQAQGQFGVEVPLFIYSHSMGGNLALNFLFKEKSIFPIAGVITSGAWIELEMKVPSWKMALGKMVKSIAPSFSQGAGLDVNLMSYDKQNIESYKSDPLIHDEISATLGLGAMEAGEWLVKNEHTTSVPVLMMHGEDDKITSPAATKKVAQNIKGDISLKIWPMTMHEIHNEENHTEVFQFVLNWVNEKIIRS